MTTEEEQERKIEEDLEAGRLPDGFENLDLSLPWEQELMILRNMRTKYTQDYFQLKTSSRLNRLVGNVQLADAQDKDNKNLVKQIAQLERDIQKMMSEHQE